MTGYTVHTGASQKFVAGWDKIFKGGKAGGKAEKPATTRQAARPKSRKKK